MRLSPNLATVALFCDNVERALVRVCQLTPESCAVVLYVNAGSAESNVELTVSRRDAAAQRAPCNAKSVQKRDTPRKRSEPIPSSVHSATTAAASVSCPAGFTVPAEHDPVCV